MSLWSQIGFADPKSVSSKNLILYHDMTMVVVVIVLTIVGGFLMVFLCKKLFMKNLTARYCYSNNKIEIFWSTVPAIFLVVLGYFSLRALYKHEVGDNVEHLVKTTGHQWYWAYEYSVDMDYIDSKSELEDTLASLGYFKTDWPQLKANEDNSVDALPDEPALLGLEYSVDDNSVDALPNGPALLELGYSVDDNSVNALPDWSALLELEYSVDDNSVDALPDGPALLELEYKVMGNGLVTNNRLDFDYESTLADVVVDGEPEIEMEHYMGRAMFALFFGGDWYYVQESFNYPEEDLDDGGLRHLEVSDWCYFIRSMKNELSLITADVMHSWGVPEMGVKIDAIPGRSNSIAIIPYESGVSHGNCYELCGPGHSQMPISVAVTNKNNFGLISHEAVINESEGLESISSEFTSWTGKQL